MKQISEEEFEELEKDIYNPLWLEEYVEDDMMSSEEQAFMIGYLAA